MPNDGLIFRFEGDTFVCVHCRPNSGVVQMTSNLADAKVAKMYADGIRESGGHVFSILPAGTLVAALKLVKKDFEHV